MGHLCRPNFRWTTGFGPQRALGAGRRTGQRQRREGQGIFCPVSQQLPAEKLGADALPRPICRGKKMGPVPHDEWASGPFRSRLPWGILEASEGRFLTIQRG